MTSGRTPSAAFTPRLRKRIDRLLVAAAGALLMGHHAASARCHRRLRNQPLVGPDGAAYLVCGGLLTCDSGNNCTGGLTGPKTETAGSTGLVWGNPTLQVDAATAPRSGSTWSTACPPPRWHDWK
jgi:hypothetical protein